MVKLFIVIISILIFTTCKFSEITNAEKTANQNEIDIQAYLSKNTSLTFQKTSSGLYYSKLEPRTGRSAFVGEQVAIKYSGRLLDGTLYDDANVTKPITLPFGANSLLKGLEEGLSLMNVGEKTRLIIPAKLGYGAGSIRGTTSILVPPYSVLVLDVEFVSVRNEEEQINSFMLENNLKGERRESGLRYITTKAGTGRAVSEGTTVNVEYTGKFLDGTVFDRSAGRNPSFTQTNSSGIIKGWFEALPLMKEGESAILIMPSSLGYSSGSKNTSRGSIPDYSPLYFELTITSVNGSK
jgi:FKBP-type peptidyl-prolyl cis-trans isomerase FkpA